MSSLTFSDETPLHSVSQLVAWMLDGAKPRERWVVGTEHEKFGWWPDQGTYPTFEGPRGIGEVLRRLVAERGWLPTFEGDDIIALSRGAARITLEPGGQFELSGAPLRTLAETEAELLEHLAEVREICAPLGIEFSGLGVAPVLSAEQMPRMPKQRYQIMRSYLPTRGALAMWMMHSTCTVQANFDFADAADAMRKFRAALLIQPLVMAAFANSGIAEGHVLDVVCQRGRIWEATDNDRWRFPDALLAPEATLEDYVNWALDVPMFFIHRNGAYIECAGLPFRTYMTEGYAGHRANLGDFGLHLSTLFPDVRLKQFLEVRAADMGNVEQVMALPALHLGLLYDDQARDAVLAALGDWRAEEWWALRLAVPAEGLEATLRGQPAKTWLAPLIQAAREGLERLEPGSGRHLDALQARVAAGVTPAALLQAEFTGDVNALMRATRIA